MNKPAVSIIMSTYNDAAYVKEAIDSVLQQSFTDWEFIIINDASTDNSDAIIRSYAKNDKRFRYFLNKENKGQTKNSMEGVTLSRGDFIARIDGDDIWIDKNKLRKQMDFLNANPEYGLVGSFWSTINTQGEKILQAPNLIDDKKIRDYFLRECCFLHSSVVMRKSILDIVGSYNSQYVSAQDYDLFLRIGKVSKLYNIPEYMVAYRQNPNGMTQSKYKRQIQCIIMFIKNYRHDYPNFTRSYILWHIRQYLPKWTRQQIPKNNKLLKMLTYHKYGKYE